MPTPQQFSENRFNQFQGFQDPFQGFFQFGNTKQQADKLRGDRTPSSDLNATAINILSRLNTQGSTGLDIGFPSINNILFSQGRTDPALMNRELTDIARTTQSQQDQFQGRMAGLNQGSNVHKSILAAIGAGGDQARADRLAQESQLTEQRKRQDLAQLFGPLLLDPFMQSLGIERGVSVQNRQIEQQNKAAQLAFAGQVLGGIGGFF